MYYYIVVGDVIVDYSKTCPSQAELQRLADGALERVYVIAGQHAGLTATPRSARPTKAQQAELLAEEFSRKE